VSHLVRPIPVGVRHLHDHGRPYGMARKMMTEAGEEVSGLAGDLRVIRSEDRAPEEASGAMVREAAISKQLVGAERIWAGYVELGPGLVSAVHHHGEAESVIYVISGRARFFSGDRLDSAHEAGPGDLRVGAAPRGPRGDERQRHRDRPDRRGPVDPSDPGLQPAHTRGLDAAPLDGSPCRGS